MTSPLEILPTEEVDTFQLRGPQDSDVKGSPGVTGEKNFSNLSRSSLGSFSHHTIAKGKKLDVIVTVILKRLP